MKKEYQIPQIEEQIITVDDILVDSTGYKEDIFPSNIFSN